MTILKDILTAREGETINLERMADVVVVISSLLFNKCAEIHINNMPDIIKTNFCFIIRSPTTTTDMKQIFVARTSFTYLFS